MHSEFEDSLGYIRLSLKLKSDHLLNVFFYLCKTQIYRIKKSTNYFKTLANIAAGARLSKKHENQTLERSIQEERDKVMRKGETRGWFSEYVHNMLGKWKRYQKKKEVYTTWSYRNDYIIFNVSHTEYKHFPFVF